MLLKMILFELRYRQKKISTYLYFAMFFLMGYFAILLSGGAFPKTNLHFFGAGTGNVNANAPFVIFVLLSIFSHVGILITAAIFGSAGFRDFKENVFSLNFSYPVKKRDYILSKYLGAFISTMFIFAGGVIGTYLASVSTFVDHSKFGVIRITAYLQPYLTVIMPNLLYMGAIFFAMALLMRKIFPVYLSGITIFTGYLIATSLLRDVSNQFIAGLIDPFGRIASQKFFEYWTPAQKNVFLIPFEGQFLLNRVLWISVGIAILAFMYRKFRFAYLIESRSRKRGNNEREMKLAVKIPQYNLLPIKTEQVFNFMSYFRQMIFTALNEFKILIMNIYFLSILLLGLIFMFITSINKIGQHMGTPTYPLTYQVLEITSGKFSLFLALIVIIFSGELVWRERNSKTQQIYDALPVPGWVMFLGKLGALFMIQVVLMLFVLLGSIFLQVIHGFYNFELGLYFKELIWMRLSFFLHISVLAMLIQVVVNNKYFGHFIVVLYLILEDSIAMLGFEHNLYRYASFSQYIYSDMNGYGPFLKPVLFFQAYWSVFAALLIIVAILFRVRGNDTNFKERLKSFRERITKPVKVSSLICFVLWAILGLYIFFNTNIINKYRSSRVMESLSATYEKKYKKYEVKPQLRKTAIKLNVDIYPYKRSVISKGDIILKNKTAVDVDEIYIHFPFIDGYVKNIKLSVPATITLRDIDFGSYIFKLHSPVKPGEEISMKFDFRIYENGFKNNDLNTRLVQNGTFLTPVHLIPIIGYDSRFEIEDNDIRKKYGLKSKERMASIDDSSARMNYYISKDADWIDFEVIVSTSTDQIAITSGELLKEWTENDRHYFHYKTCYKILNFFSIVSARYEVRKDKWNDIGIEVYYHKKHHYNIDRIIKSVRMSLEYCSKNFSSYRYKQVRVVEFPRYELFAQSFATFIPYSEGVGFIAKIDKDNVDYVFDTTAHEMGHQWWGHQVISADVQGSTMLSEILAQYTALQIDKTEYNQDQINTTVKYEIDRYLKGRANEKRKEVPIYLVEDQGYIHYGKGQVVMNALQDYIGEDNLNKILAEFVKKTAYNEPPYPISRELIDLVRQYTPDHLKYIITDMFETITLYDNKAVSASYEELKTGKYLVKFKFSTMKLRADEKGNEKQIDINDCITFGVFGYHGKKLYLKKYLVKKGDEDIEFIVDEIPIKAAIDPYFYLIDKNTENNDVKIKAL